MPVLGWTSLSPNQPSNCGKLGFHHLCNRNNTPSLPTPLRYGACGDQKGADRQGTQKVSRGREEVGMSPSAFSFLSLFPGVRSEFAQVDTSNPNCVVIADAGESFSYQNMNKAFQVLMELDNPVLISLGRG